MSTEDPFEKYLSNQNPFFAFPEAKEEIIPELPEVEQKSLDFPLPETKERKRVEIPETEEPRVDIDFRGRVRDEVRRMIDSGELR